MGPPSYMRSVVDRNVVMRRIPVHSFRNPSYNRSVASPKAISSQILTSCYCFQFPVSSPFFNVIQ